MQFLKQHSSQYVLPGTQSLALFGDVWRIWVPGLSLKTKDTKKIPRFCLNLVGENLSKESERSGVCAIFLRQTLCKPKNRRSLSTESLWTIIIRNLATHSFTADCHVEEQEKLSSESAHPQKLETILLPAFQQLSQKILMVLTINNATSKSVFTVS